MNRIYKYTLLLFICVFEGCTQDRTKADGLLNGLLPGKTYYIEDSRAGIPNGLDFPRGKMNELKPFKAFLILKESKAEEYVLSIDYQFQSKYRPISSITFAVSGIRMKDNPDEEQVLNNLFGNCIVNNHVSTFEDISIRGSLSSGFSIEGLIRGCPFRLEIRSITESAAMAPSFYTEDPIIEYMYCWKESVHNASNQECTVICSTESGTIQFSLEPGCSWKKTFYGDGGGLFWGGYCDKIEIRSKGETITTLSGMEQITHSLNDAASLFHQTEALNDYYLFSTQFGGIEAYPYCRETVTIVF